MLQTCCKQNAVADALCRVEILTIHQDLAAAQLTDPETEDTKTSITNLRWKVVKIGETSLLCDISTGRPRPFVPKCFRRNIFEMIHTLSHPSIRATIQLVTEKFVCHAMKKDITAWTRTCVSYQRSKIHMPTHQGISRQLPTTSPTFWTHTRSYCWPTTKF